MKLTDLPPSSKQLKIGRGPCKQRPVLDLKQGPQNRAQRRLLSRLKRRQKPR